MELLVNIPYYTETLLFIDSDVYEKAEEMALPKDGNGFYEGKFLVSVVFIPFNQGE